MKCIVISNCAALAYINALKLLFPSADVRGVRLDQAEKWIVNEPKQSFIDFLAVADVFVGSDPASYPFLSLPDATTRVIIPPFLFRGYQPDVFQLFGGPPSVLGKEGVIYSRIVTVAYLMGLNQKEIESCFQPEIFADAHYLDAYDQERSQLRQTFTPYGIDIDQLWEKWKTEQPFLYLPNHCTKQVYTDLLTTALDHHSLQPEAHLDRDSLLAQVECIFPKPAIWPIYPGIAERHEMVGTYEWRTSITSGHQLLDLEQFVSLSRHQLNQFESLSKEHVPGFEQCYNAINR